MTDLTDKILKITMPDGSVWEAELRFIIESRAIAYEEEFDCYDDAIYNTIEYFSEDTYRIKEWACNLDWATLKAVKVDEPEEPDYNHLWYLVDENNMKVV